jgi:hypothetical protein
LKKPNAGRHPDHLPKPKRGELGVAAASTMGSATSAARNVGFRTSRLSLLTAAFKRLSSCTPHIVSYA